MKFEWNPQKAAINQKKHQVDFPEASTVFNDPLSITYADPDHSFAEARYIIIGYSHRQRLLIVSHTDRHDCVRIISAREVTRQERRLYEEGL